MVHSPRRSTIAGSLFVCLVGFPVIAAAQDVAPPPLVNAEGKVIPPPATPSKAPPPPPGQKPPSPPPAEVAPAPAPTPAPTPAPAPEAGGVKVSNPNPTPEPPAPEPVVREPTPNAVTLDLARLLDASHGVVPAAGLGYERRFGAHWGVDVGLRIPFTGSVGPGSETLSAGASFTDTAYPWILLGGRYQFVGRELSGPFLSAAIGITAMQSQWQATNARANVPKPGNGSPVSDCTPQGAASPSYCLLAAGGAFIANGGYSYVLFGHLLLEAALGLEFGFGGTEVKWIGSDGRNYTHDFRPPLPSLDLTLVAGYAF